jgi:hypothetical protein
MFAATYCLWRYLRAPSRGRLLLAASVFAVAQLTKATALFLGPIFALILAARVLGELVAAWKSEQAISKDAARLLARRAAQGALLLLVFGLAALVALNLGFRFEGTGTPLERYAFVSPAFQSLAGVPPLRTDRIRLLIERERNERGTADPEGGFRAACLELAAYSR